MKIKSKRFVVSASVFLLGIVFICYGSARGEISIVLNKAVNICLECIGLG